jgi:hypothetical protein
MTRFEVTVTMPVPIEAAFGYLAEPRNRPEWQSSLRRVVMDDPAAEPAVGVSWQEWTVVGVAPRLTITRMEPYRVWAEEGHWRGVTAGLTLHFTRISAGTRVTAEADVSGRGLWGLPAGLAARLGGPAAGTDLRRAATILAAREAGRG